MIHSLAKIHEAGPIHRDISPDNLMVNSDGNAKLLDFGAVRDIVTDPDTDMPPAESATAVFKNGYALVHFRLDLDDQEADSHIGTAEGRYVWNLLHTQNEIFPIITLENGTEETILENSAYSEIFDMEETGDFYRLNVKDLPFFNWLHNEDSTNTNIAIPSKRSGQIGIGVHVTGLNQSLSSVIYLDDIVIKAQDAAIKSFDCSAESLYNYFYRYEVEGAYE